MKKLILIPLALILLISCQNPKIIGETKLDANTQIYKKYVHFTPVSIYSDKLLTEDSLISKIDSLNSILMVTERMNNIVEIYDADSLFVGYTGNTLYNEPLTPTYIPVKGFDIEWADIGGDDAINYITYMGAIFLELNKGIYNPMGYQPRYKYAPVDSQTGRVRFTSYIEKGPLIVFDSLVFQVAFSKENGVKRYKNYQYAQNSDFGKVLEKEIDKYLRKSIDTLYIDRAFWRAYRGY